MATARGELEFLVRSPHRVQILEALVSRPRTRADLRTITGASASTISRALRAFEDRRWVRRTGSQYAVTDRGAFVATAVNAALERFELEDAFRDRWEALPMASASLELTDFEGATITPATVTDPYRPVARVRSLVSETEHFRFAGFELALLEPCREALCERIIDGMRATVIDPPAVSAYIRSTYPELSRRTLASGNITVWLHDDLPPYGLLLCDDRVGICLSEPETGAVEALIDTEDERVRTWGEWTFEAYRQAAEPLRVEPEAEAE